MIKKYTILWTFISLIGLSSAKADRFETIPTGTYSWDDPAAWVGGIVPDGDIKNNDSIIIRNEVVLMTSLGVRNGAQLTIAGTMILFNPNGGIVLENKGNILVDGILRILPGLNGVPNTLDHEKGTITINGTLENIGSHIYNDADIAIEAGGTLRNFGYRDAVDDLILRADNFDLYNLYEFGTDLFGYSLDPGSIIGGTGGPYSGIPSDSIDYSSLTWTCFAGQIENDGDIINLGGVFDESDCGGGMLSGAGTFSPIDACTAPENLRTSGSNSSTGLTFRWDAVPDALGYYAAFKQAGTSRYRIIRPLTRAVTSISFSRNFFPSGIQVDWAVLTVCDPGEIDMNLLTEGAATQMRTASVSLDNEPTISLYPNPVTDYLVVESSLGSLQGTISLLDLSGRMVLEQVLSIAAVGQKQTVSLLSLDPGLYMVKINDGSSIHQESLLVSR